ncbi:MAG: tetratricopeptide repeat protein, partial [Verrucomicrobia bacterium]|nr:tetratricopeptide repeat protein [Verrucomicrobiota bacterium]
MRREQNWSRWRRLMVAAVLLGSALTVGSSQAETVRRVALQPNDATPAALGASSLAAAELSPGGASPSDRIGREGLYNAVSAMLITEAELVKESEGKKKAGLRGHVDKPSRASELMYAGLDDVLDEEFERAIPKLEAAIEAEPTLLSVWSTLGWTYWRVDRKDDAIALWQRLLALDEDSPVPHMLLGNGYVGTEELKKGEMHLKRSIELDPTLVEPRLVLSSVYRWTGRHRASIKLLSELLAESPDRLDIQNELALSLYHNGDYDEALPLLQQGVRAVPDNRQLVTAHARCLLHTGNVTEATLRAKRLVKDGGVDMDLLLLLADAPRYRDSPAEAVPYLEDIARNAKDPIIRREALRRLNELYVRLWEREPERYPLNKAIAAVKKLIDMDPDFIQWQQALGELYMLDRQYVPAESTFKDVISNGNTNSLNAHLGLCETYQAAKSFDRAVEQFEIASEVNPRNPYHFSMEARLEMSRAGVDEAAEAIDKLEAAGSRGAVAVLLYRGLSDSDWSDRMSVRRFRLHILALKQAGFKFLTPEELPDYFASLERPEDDLDEHRPDR